MTDTPSVGVEALRELRGTRRRRRIQELDWFESLYRVYLTGILGIVITLLLSVYERRRELGLMRAVGTTRGQVAGSTLWESVLTALIGAVMGVALGLVLGWVVVRALRDQGLSSFSLPVSSIAIFTVVAIVLAVIAAVIPARRAAKADILSAIATT